LMPGYNLVTNFAAMDLSGDREAIDYAVSAFSAVPRDAVIVADGDQRFFALLYYRHVIARDESRVAVVSRELLQYDWYYDAVQKTMPALPDKSFVPTYVLRVQEVVDQNRAEGRVVYSTIQGDALAQWVMQSDGVLFRITGRQQ
jgi:hypothetical protein